MNLSVTAITIKLTNPATIKNSIVKMPTCDRVSFAPTKLRDFSLRSWKFLLAFYVQSLESH